MDMTSRRRTVNRVARALIPARLRPRARTFAVRQGWVREPPFLYPFAEIMERDTSVRPQYVWGCLCAASLAQNLGLSRISVIEFGVAGGNGLLELERIASKVETLSGVSIDVYGFDSGRGLPKPKDYRDLPQLWAEGDYRIDVDGLRARLSRAKLVLGRVADTVPHLVSGDALAPVGFVSFDLDMYSSTVEAFVLFDARHDLLLPRVVCAFDDIVGYSHSDFAGERLAISEFNQAHETRKISRIYGLRYILRDQAWTQMMYLFHDFEHQRYTDYDGTNPLRQIPLTGA
jgi:hypothetical protein